MDIINIRKGLVCILLMSVLFLFTGTAIAMSEKTVEDGYSGYTVFQNTAKGNTNINIPAFDPTEISGTVGAVKSPLNNSDFSNGTSYWNARIVEDSDGASGYKGIDEGDLYLRSLGGWWDGYNGRAKVKANQQFTAPCNGTIEFYYDANVLQDESESSGYIKVWGEGKVVNTVGDYNYGDSGTSTVDVTGGQQYNIEFETFANGDGDAWHQDDVELYVSTIYFIPDNDANCSYESKQFNITAGNGYSNFTSNSEKTSFEIDLPDDNSISTIDIDTDSLVWNYDIKGYWTENTTVYNEQINSENATLDVSFTPDTDVTEGTLQGYYNQIDFSNYDYVTLNDVYNHTSGTSLSISEYSRNGEYVSADVENLDAGTTYNYTFTVEYGDINVNWIHDSYNVQAGQTTTAGLDFSIENFDDDWYDYRVDVYNPDGNLVDLINISSAESTLVTYFDNNNKPGTYTAKLQKISYTVQGQSIETLATDSTQLDKSEPNAQIGWGSSSYRKGVNATVYYYAPNDSTIVIQGVDEKTGTTTYQETWTKSGSGSITVNIPSDTPATSYGASVIYDGQNLADDYAAILSSASEVKLSGKVKDAATGATLENAKVIVDGTSVYTSPNGRYSITVTKGTDNSITVSKSGYESKNFSGIAITSDSVRNFYLSPTGGTGGGGGGGNETGNETDYNLYGTITNYDTDNKIANVLVTLENSSKVYTVYSNEQGYYEFTGLKNGSSYTLDAKKTGFDSHVANISIYNPGIKHDFKMVPDEDQDGPTPPGGGGGDETIPDHRKMVSETVGNLYNVVPGLFGILMLFLLMTVLKRGAK